MEGVNLEEKCLLLKSADKEEEETSDAKEEKGGVEEDLKEKDGEKSTAVKLVGQVQNIYSVYEVSENLWRCSFKKKMFCFDQLLFLPQVAGKKSTWKIVEKQFIQVWSSAVALSSGCLNVPHLSGKGCFQEWRLEIDLLIRHFPEGSPIIIETKKQSFQGSRGLQDLNAGSDNEHSASGEDYDSEGATNSEVSNE